MLLVWMDMSERDLYKFGLVANSLAFQNFLHRCRFLMSFRISLTGGNELAPYAARGVTKQGFVRKMGVPQSLAIFIEKTLMKLIEPIKFWWEPPWTNWKTRHWQDPAPPSLSALNLSKPQQSMALPHMIIIWSYMDKFLNREVRINSDFFSEESSVWHHRLCQFKWQYQTNGFVRLVNEQSQSNSWNLHSSSEYVMPSWGQPFLDRRRWRGKQWRRSSHALV